MMYCIDSYTINPFLNLAVEEYLLKNRPEEFFLLSINSRAVVAGKHQCIHREVNTRFVTENNIPVIRRISGGGTVFHDEGNLNFSFIRNCEAGKQVDFPRYTRPVIDFLQSLGINALLEGSDIKVDGLKISGNAEHVHRNRVLHHGTLLWKASLDTLRSCLRKDTSSYKTRAVASRPSTVTNLAEKLNEFRDTGEFRSAVMDYFLKTIPGAEVYRLSDEEIREVEKLSPKYATWEWNYAYGPEYEFSGEFEFRGKKVSGNLTVKDGLITKCNIEDDPGPEKICRKLTGIKHMPEELRKALGDQGLNENDVYNFF